MAPRKFIDVSLSGDACITWALMLLVLPLKWIICALLAAAFHEFFHYLALTLCGVRVNGLRISSGGAVMETEPIERSQELISALAGPVGSLLLLFLIRRLPELAVCGGVQGLYNLLPIFPLDGGRAVRSILGMLGMEKLAEPIQWITIALILILGFVAFYYLDLGFGILLVTILLIRKVLPRKIPCKEARKRVQ